MGRTYGYARVSSVDQVLSRQIDDLIKNGVEERNIFSEKVSGKNFDRPVWNMLIGTENTASLLREGDLLVICSIDRLGRNYNEIKDMWYKITKEIKANIRVLDMPLLDTSPSENGELPGLERKFIADIVLQILSYAAEKERNYNKVRQAEGIAAAKKRGVHMGRPRKEFPENWNEAYTEWKKGKITAVEAMKRTELPKTTFYSFVKKHEGRD